MGYAKIFFLKKQDAENTNAKSKINKLDFVKIRDFCSPKDTKRVTRQTTEWKKVILQHMFNKSVIL